MKWMVMSRFDFFPTPLQDLSVVQQRAVEDQRGFLSRLFCADEFREIGLKKSIVQINHTLTRKQGTVRGLHFQYPPYAENKLISCLQGEIFDVAVDLRCNSPTFLRWHGVRLSAQNHQSLFIPEGFAHGFQTLTADCELIYLHTAVYQPEAEGALNAADPKLDIDWPLAISELSERDRNHKMIGSEFQGVSL